LRFAGGFFGNIEVPGRAAACRAAAVLIAAGDRLADAARGLASTYGALRSE
jgi:hypothetical protein